MVAKLIQFATAEGAEHENSTDEGSIYRKIFAPGELRKGTVWRFLAGCIVNDNNSTDTVTPRLRFGTTSATPASNTAIGAAGAIDSEDADIGYVDATLVMQSETRGVFTGRITTVDAVPVEVAFGPVIVTVDPTVAHYLDYTLDWSVAHADNEAAATHGIVVCTTE